MKNCHRVPPQEIYDVLHFAEENGMELPESVEVWWEKETGLNEAEKADYIDEVGLDFGDWGKITKDWQEWRKPAYKKKGPDRDDDNEDVPPNIRGYSV